TSSNFNSNGKCGACAQVTNTGNGRSVVVTIIDECPQDSNPVCAGNPNGHLDLSKSAFDTLGFSTGNPSSGVAWKYVPCPTAGGVKLRIKPGNPNQVFIENEVTAIASVVSN